MISSHFSLFSFFILAFSHGHEDERGQSLIRFIAPDLINDKENPDQVKMRYLLMSPSGRILGSSTEMEIMDSHCEEVEVFFIFDLLVKTHSFDKLSYLRGYEGL